MNDDDGMTDLETAAHIRRWAVRENSRGIFSWPTDGCGYSQHIQFVKYRNAKRYVSDLPWAGFVLEYADMLEREARERGETK